MNNMKTKENNCNHEYKLDGGTCMHCGKIGGLFDLSDKVMKTKENPKLVKCYEITPSPKPQYDSFIVRAGETWQPALELIEETLETLYLTAKDEGRPWTDIKITLRCIEKSEEELEEIEDNV